MSTSDTPRPTPETDAFIAAGPGDLYDYISALADRARKLERERDEWRDQFHAAIENVRGLEQLLDRAEREREEAREENASLHCLLQEAKRGADLANAELKELRAENAALRADKARLDWLERTKRALATVRNDGRVNFDAEQHNGEWFCTNADGFREAIDAGIKADAAMQEGR